MAIIANLDADTLATHAQNVFVFHGRHVICARLIYRALSLNFDHYLALRSLSDFFSDTQDRYSVAILEYLVSKQVPISGHAYLQADWLLFFTKWSLGFNYHTSGSTNLAYEAFEDRSQFTVDDQAYHGYLDEVIEEYGSLRNVVVAAHTLAGVVGELIAFRGQGEGLTDDLIYPERFRPTAEYDLWLKSGSEQFDEMAALKAQGKVPSAPLLMNPPPTS